MTDETRARQLLTFLPLGDNRPSDLLNYMVDLAPAKEHAWEFFMKQIFLMQLPEPVKAALVDVPLTPDRIKEFAGMADTAWRAAKAAAAAATNRAAPIAAAAPVAPAPVALAPVAPAPVAPAPVASGGGGLCIHHIKYGVAATKCLYPCSWVE